MAAPPNFKISVIMNYMDRDGYPPIGHTPNGGGEAARSLADDDRQR
jgi:hypothetical protein